MRNLIEQGNFHGPKVLVITRFHCYCMCVSVMIRKLHVCVFLI